MFPLMRSFEGRMPEQGKVWNLRNAIGSSSAVALVLSAVAIFVVYSMVQIVFSDRMTLLYGGLDESELSSILDRLDGKGVDYHVRGNAVFVKEDEKDKLRMVLAGEMLPRKSQNGYEILEDLNAFSSTSQMYDAALHRALEGELSRTISASDFVTWARVHLSLSKRSGLQGNVHSSASVLVRPVGDALSYSQVKAIRHLIASSVAGLGTGNVSVVNAVSGILESDLDFEVGDARELISGMRSRAESLLSAYVGYGNSRVEISVETDNRTERIVEKLVDPDRRVEISSETRDLSNVENSSDSGAVTVASNVPNSNQGGNATQKDSRQGSERNERKNYEISETNRQTDVPPGKIERISVAILVSDLKNQDENGEVEWVARSEAELADLKELVSSAIGVDEERGDVVTIKSMRFHAGQFGVPELPDLKPEALGGVLVPVIKTVLICCAILGVSIFVLKPSLIDNLTYSIDGQIGNNAELEELSSDVTNTALEFSNSDIGSGELDFPSFESIDVGDYEEIGLGSGGGLLSSVDSRRNDAIEILRGWLEIGFEKG
ncbi:flagellar basal-body MS-ring/collar protein FliF [Poseidonocella sp. HB161398]|uniref:flagellar basal-body MS-ring/collar protein FliF n=1 Tax=Poseidonocella sp. HB161398 TaxID=2320855 RepID=UPI00110920AF|nr:flagellar basal-body MS-ring/collar protein FliF [Poseidonocella sp. HB161398]